MAAMATVMAASKAPNYSERLASSGVVDGVARPVVRRRPMEEIYGIRLERSATKERLQQLAVDKWSMWESGECEYIWDWKVDEWVFIEQGSLIVCPINSQLMGEYHAGDLVRFPKWFDALLTFRASPVYQQRYKFVAYGDTELD